MVTGFSNNGFSNYISFCALFTADGQLIREFGNNGFLLFQDTISLSGSRTLTTIAYNNGEFFLALQGLEGDGRIQIIQVCAQ